MCLQSPVVMHLGRRVSNASAINCRNRGTECMRSPEMLLATSNPTAEQQAGLEHAASDVWALGCLLYELVTGAVLFPNELDWAKFFITVTDPTQVQAIISVGTLLYL